MLAFTVSTVALTAAAPAPVLAAEAAQCKTVRFGDVGWSDIAATTGTASVVLQGLGYQTKTQIASVPVVFLGLKKKDIDVFLGNWMPTMETFIKPYVDDKSIEVVRANLEGAKYTLAVPTYAAEGGLRSFADIAKFKDKLDGKIYGIEAGNDGNVIIDNMIKGDAFGLKDFRLVESSEAGMLSQIKRAARSKQWAVFLGWEPHPMNKAIDMTYLTGGDDWFGPNLGGATVYTNVPTGYRQTCPNVGKFLENLVFDLNMENEIMTAIIDDHQQPEAAATAWLKNNPKVLETWLAGVTTADGKDGLAAVRKHLKLT
ncbi:glycine/betaine ABC transporter substrate-binding protein [Skermanella stibiiresistens SB22]|uniref:Glycine/betaine ABC transporter substrate-binding protein n=1 Tax=Skermanella stibiiresistens SB22 TaxID=1385369 RepID=W9H9Q6_9PROT|nr:glycine/betaine ABC transporter substrate-binding protein [Skermanella stibiiresistens SB22]